MRSIHDRILEQIRSGMGTVLATVVRASGSTPQKPGSSALFGEEGLLAGTVGGGPLEGEVQHIAESVIISRASDQFYFNLDSEKGSDGAICGGEAEVLIDASPSAHLAVFERMEASLSERTDGYLLTGVSRKQDSGRTLRRYWIRGSSLEELPHDMGHDFKELIKDHLKYAERYGFVEIDLSSIPHQVEMAYLEHIKPMPHLVIAGGGHIGKALAHLGSLLEFEVTVVDDRPEFASVNHIPDADHFLDMDFSAAMGEINTGPDTYFVIVTRGHVHDGEALKACIGSGAAYIGMIGSAHKVGIMRKQFLEEHWSTPEQWSSIHTPIGLDIGSKTVQEIAISIAAQLVEVRNKKMMANAE
jgi:xanthine dehydrogenase accessory factor